MGRPHSFLLLRTMDFNYQLQHNIPLASEILIIGCSADLQHQAFHLLQQQQQQ